MDLQKKIFGQFFTRKNFWLQPHVLEFIKSIQPKVIFDPFAGKGDLLEVARTIGFSRLLGCDIDESLKWKKNDSLLHVPKIKDSVVLTNPPYLTNYSAKRKGIFNQVQKYFNKCRYSDLYQLAIEKCLANDYGVMIVPETFINSTFPKNRLVSITIIEDSLFSDTDTPVCVICFDNKNKSLDEVKIYKNNIFLGTLQSFEQMRKIPKNNINIQFNAPDGQIALRAVDTTNPLSPVSFMKPEEINYDLSKIKFSSRLITTIKIVAQEENIGQIINFSNQILFSFREECHDILLSPFKGNKKDGTRRRRLDYLTARAVLEDAYELTEGSLTPTLFPLKNSYEKQYQAA